MADRAQLYNDPEEAFRLSFEGKQSSMWTASPGIITEIDLAKNTCSVQLAVQGVVEDDQGVKQFVNMPILADVPIVWPRGGGFALTFPVAAGDEVLVVFGARCIDSWWQSGGIGKPMEARMHDLSDGFAIPGPASQPKKLASVSASKIQLRNEAGTVFFSVGTKFSMTNSTTDLKTVLTDLETLLNTFMTTLAGFSGGVAPVTQAMIQAPAATAQTQLATLLTKIGALLE